jgi:hypothetical protein
MHWNLRLVRNEKEGERRFRIREIFYDDEGRPELYSDARLRDIIRFWKDWASSPRLVYPTDFTQ